MTQQAMERPPGAPAGYRLKFPGSWWHLDLDPSTRDASIRRKIEDQVKNAPLSRERVDDLIRDTRRTARDAYAQGALQAAGMLRVLNTGDGALVLSATTIVLRVSVPEEQSEDLAELIVAAALQVGADAEGTGLPVGEVEMVDLPQVGPVGRITRIEEVETKGKRIPTVMRHVLIPVPNSREYLVLANSTTNVHLAEQFHDVFDAIAESFRFDDLTGPTQSPSTEHKGK
ncbi:hypothetical protein GTY65_09440 [Streptomyces sp. SID8379]|uniref:hypothetical protein n=1 Tax=unclassified Streptomyces TaxID=2593676 RepID=UPI00036283C1|nr:MULTISPECIES: hypothetical protein [unclassified Streptomyces]MYW64295.1 hypothetical protein [Streptomyces sp. SID8379]